MVCFCKGKAIILTNEAGCGWRDDARVAPKLFHELRKHASVKIQMVTKKTLQDFHFFHLETL
jgi:hypothetical protein